MSVRRIFVEKKPEFAVKAGELKEELEKYLGISHVKGVRVLVRYDVENLSEETYRQALGTIFSEPPVDLVYEEEFPRIRGDMVFSVEYLPGQFDQRADSAEQCVKLLRAEEGAGDPHGYHLRDHRTADSGAGSGHQEFLHQSRGQPGGRRGKA